MVKAAPVADTSESCAGRDFGRAGQHRETAAGDRQSDVATGPSLRASAAVALVERNRFGGSLAELAADLIALAQLIRDVGQPLDVDQLRREAIAAIERFRRQAAAASYAEALVLDASYILCSFLDETVLNTPWGADSSWSQHSLLCTFHQETYGGERAFWLIREALDNWRSSQPLLELVYLCLALGFAGRYRVDVDGNNALAQLREQIYRALQEPSERASGDLIPSIEPAVGVRSKFQTYSSIWLLAGCLSLFATGWYGWLLLDINQRSDRLIEALSALVPPPLLPERTLPSNPDAERLRDLLAAEIKRGVLIVAEHGPRISVMLSTETMFDAGSAEIHEGFRPILDKLGKALEIIPGRVVVTGHTDSSAIRTARFPSNWHLSLARASEVVKYIAGVASLRGRMLPEGRGPAEPRADNGSAEGRAKNRRVTIDIYPPGPTISAD